MTGEGRAIGRKASRTPGSRAGQRIMRFLDDFVKNILDLQIIKMYIDGGRLIGASAVPQNRRERRSAISPAGADR